MYVYRVFNKTNGDMILKGAHDQHPSPGLIKDFVWEMYRLHPVEIEILVTIED